jgi:hypothetical protein
VKDAENKDRILADVVHDDERETGYDQLPRPFDTSRAAAFRKTGELAHGSMDADSQTTGGGGIVLGNEGKLLP